MTPSSAAAASSARTSRAESVAGQDLFRDVLGEPRRAGHVTQDVVIRELPALGEVRGEQPLHQRVLALGTTGRLGQPVGVERAAQLHPVEVEGHADLLPQCGEPRLAGP